jgi:hypothetical protein
MPTTKAQRARRFRTAKTGIRLDVGKRSRTRRARPSNLFAKQAYSESWCSSCLCGSSPKIRKRTHALGAGKRKGERVQGRQGARHGGRVQQTIFAKRTHAPRAPVQSSRFKVQSHCSGPAVADRRYSLFFQTNPFSRFVCIRGSTREIAKRSHFRGG